MSRPVYAPVAVVSSIEGWDALITDNFNATADALANYPLPIAKYAAISGGSGPPTASSYDQCICVANDSVTAGWVIMVSDGAAWNIVPKRAAAQANSVAGTLGALVTDFNSLLAKLRASGVIAP